MQKVLVEIIVPKEERPGGWGFAQFTNSKPDDEAVHKTCFACHQPAKDHDFVFTHYYP